MHGRWYPTTIVVALLALAGCGGGGKDGPTVPATPALQRTEVHGQQITVRGDYAPDQFGPFTLDGRYRVRFTQRGAGVDFGREVPFTAHLREHVARSHGRSIDLFQRAARTGATTVTAHGRFDLIVDFGDSPYAVVIELAALPR
jgi:hypothetical protein